jgi:hypothetical protein
MIVRVWPDSIIIEAHTRRSGGVVNRMTVMTTALLWGATLAGIGCSSPPAGAPGSGGAAPDASAETRSAALGDTIHIRLGRSASVDNGRLLLTFRSHGADSRCPANVVCVWMGDVVLRVGARAGRSTADAELHTGLEPHTLTIDRYVVKAVGMLPYPGTTPSDSTPIALLVVTAK